MIFLLISTSSALICSGQTGKKTTGIASYYGPGFHGRKTSSGERFHQDSLTCAHKTFAFGTRLKVTNLKNDKSVCVRVNDRMPTYNKREIDLSRGAAKQLAMLSSGVAKVEIENLGLINLENEKTIAYTKKPKEASVVPKEETHDTFVIQLAVFKVYDNMIKFHDYVKLKGFGNVNIFKVKTKKETLYKIYLGPYINEEAPEADLKKLEEEKIDAYLRKKE